jgi:hypothetical protein
MLDINYFLRAIRRETLEIVGTQVNVEDVKDELFDIVKPAISDRITVDDLIACRQGGTGADLPPYPPSLAIIFIVCTHSYRDSCGLAVIL